MMEIERIKHAVNTLMHKNYTITIEDGTIIKFNFQIQSFFHLFGFHYLIDMPDISKSKRKDEIVRRFLNQGITVADLKRSLFFHKIERRILLFPIIEDMLINNRCKIIVDFDPSLLSSTSVNVKYFLYQTDDYASYRLFGIGCSGHYYYPETFFEERSKYYLSNQTLLDCEITYVEHIRKRKSGSAS